MKRGRVRILLKREDGSLCNPTFEGLNCIWMVIVQHVDPVGSGLGKVVVVEAVGPDCVASGEATPFKLLGLKDGQQ
ncbi:Unknown protein [Striga hermonthica]|uniref:Uncharacterized protein n=1 Tax=Striga hermonthica TaxID=68872 RepID=A0A9N7RGN9_STRHE|nr:Unknown protein [Striga hermonthica]